MFARTPGLGLVVGLAVSLAAPAVAFADESMVNLDAHTRVPVGPSGSRITVHRQNVQGRRYVAVVSPAAAASHCGGPLQRVSVWENRSDHTWVESLSDTWEPCVHVGATAVPRTVDITVLSGTDIRVDLAVPHQPMVHDSTVHYLRAGDRFVGPHHLGELASGPGEAPRGVLSPAPSGSDGDLRAWAESSPVASSHGTRIWLGTTGRILHFAAHLSPDVAQALTLVLSEPGVSTNVLQGTEGNHGRFLTLHCDDAPPRDAEFQCRNTPTGTDITGSTDVGTMVWSARVVSAVSVYAQAGTGVSRVATDPDERLHVYTVGAPVDLLQGISPDATAVCANARLHTWVPSDASNGVSGMRVLACGDRCADNDCEQHVLADTVSRVGLERVAGGFCAALTGAGSARANTCGSGGDSARLIGSFAIEGFETVVAIDRQVSHAPDSMHRAEVWVLVSPSAAWQELWHGRDRTVAGVVRMEIQGLHPRFCSDAGVCELADGITLPPPDPGLGTFTVPHIGRSAGLRQPSRF